MNTHYLFNSDTSFGNVQTACACNYHSFKLSCVYLYFHFDRFGGKKMTRCPFLRQLFKLALDSNGFGNYCRCETHNEEQHLSATKRETRSDGLPFL